MESVPSLFLENISTFIKNCLCKFDQNLDLFNLSESENCIFFPDERSISFLPMRGSTTSSIHSILDIHTYPTMISGDCLQIHFLDGLQSIPLELLKTITNDFSEKNRLGSGTFGTVYKVSKYIV